MRRKRPRDGDGDRQDFWKRREAGLEPVVEGPSRIGRRILLRRERQLHRDDVGGIHGLINAVQRLCTAEKQAGAREQR